MNNHARVKAADLKLWLFERSVHPELFDAIRRVDLERSGWRASLVISGQSHVIAVRSGGETLTEVVAASGAALPRIGARTTVQLGRERADRVVRREDGAIRYSARVSVARLGAAEYREVVDRLIAEKRLERLQAFFDDDPPLSGDTPLPFALMDFHPGARRLDVASVHACPRELAIVRVETEVEV